MKKTSRIAMCLKMGVFGLALTFGLSAFAESPRDEIVHAYRLLQTANHDYSGHRETALREVRSAGDMLGIQLEGQGWQFPTGEQQWQSDKQMREARRLLEDARGKLEQHDHDRVADRVDKAIHEVDDALNNSNNGY